MSLPMCNLCCILKKKKGGGEEEKRADSDIINTYFPVILPKLIPWAILKLREMRHLAYLNGRQIRKEG